MSKVPRDPNAPQSPMSDPEYFKKVGALGGKTTAERHGKEFLSDIGKKGAAARRAKHGPDIYKQMSEKAAEAKRAKKAQE